MFKTKGWIVGLMVLAAAGLPAPSAQASELVKLGKLLVTGKRAPSVEAKVAPAPAALRSSAEAQAAEPRGTAATGGGGGRAAIESAVEAPAVDWSDRQPETGSNPRSSPPAEPSRGAGGERVGRSPAPAAQGMLPLA